MSKAYKLARRESVAFILLLALISLFMAEGVRAQIVVTESGAAPISFSTQPLESQFRTASVPGGAAITTSNQLDNAVQTNGVNRITQAIGTLVGNPPNPSSLAVWNSSAGYIQTRPTGNAFTLLLAVLTNASGGDIATLDLNYQLTVSAESGEELPGHRVYYSKSGFPGTWQLVPYLSGDGSSGPKTAKINVTVWTNDSLLYLLWADDNGNFTDAAYQIDALSVTSVTRPHPVIEQQPADQSIAPGTPLMLSVGVIGAEPLSFQWYKDGDALPLATNREYRVNSAQPADSGNYFAQVTNVYGANQSRTAAVEVACSMPVSLTKEPEPQGITVGGTISLLVSASGTAPFRYQWYRNDAPIAGATNASYTKVNAGHPDAGRYRAVVENCHGSLISREVYVGVADLPYTLLGMTSHNWRYDASGADLGTEWRMTSFDDSMWPSGLGLLANENNFLITPHIRTVLPMTNDAGSNIITHYFRTQFVLNRDPSRVAIVASNIIDDGAVFYVNGAEVGRFNMPAGLITATTSASGSAAEGVYTTNLLDSGFFVLGTNTVAVEVHQAGVGSSDIVFGMALIARPLPNGPPTFIQQPTSQAVAEGSPFELAVKVGGPAPISLQWFADDEALPGQTNAEFNVAMAALGDTATYHVVASNAFGETRSADAGITVRSPRFPGSTVLEFTNAWRYNADGRDLGTSWRGTNFDDSAWASGLALFHNVNRSYLEQTNTVLPLFTPEGTRIVTHYFRTTFVMPGSNDTATLVFTNLLDDGAVFYLNGEELFRLRMPAGPVSFSSLAEVAPHDAREYDVVTIPNAVVKPGTNVLAVEVHQTGTSSSDVVFGSSVIAFAGSQQGVILLREPQDTAAPLHYPITLTVDAFGTLPIEFQWFKDGGAIPGETNDALNIAALQTEDAGSYFVTVSNRFSAVQSRTALVTTLGETNPPITLLRGPYLQNVTTNEITIRWRTDALSHSYVWLGTTPDALAVASMNNALATEHSVRLTGLLPNTRYYYAVASKFSNYVAGAEYSFLTAPTSARPLRIWAQGDAGTATEAARAVVNAYTNFASGRPADVWLMLGDNAYFSGYDHEYQRAVFDFMPDVLRNTPVWSTIGNHETYSADTSGHFAYYDIFSPPTAGEAGGVPSGTERYYSFNYGNIHFVCLDSEVSDRSSTGAMAEWLRQDLENNTNDWLIAFWHSPPYTHGSHNSDSRQDSGGRMVDMRETFVPILEAHGVDLVLCGHSHVYERSFLLDGHYGFSTNLAPAMVKDEGSGREGDTGAYRKQGVGPAARQGAVYVVAGSSGQATFGSLDHPAMFISLLRMGSMVIDVDDQRLNAYFLRETGEIDDQFTIVKGAPPEPLGIAKFSGDGTQATGTFKSVAGAVYQVETTTDVDASWQPLGDPITATGATTRWTNAIPAEDSRRFFRVRQVASPVGQP